MNAVWISPFIILGGALQTCGAAMNGQLNKTLVNPWLAAAETGSFVDECLTTHRDHPKSLRARAASQPHPAWPRGGRAVRAAGFC